METNPIINDLFKTADAIDKLEFYSLAYRRATQLYIDEIVAQRNDPDYSVERLESFQKRISQYDNEISKGVDEENILSMPKLQAQHFKYERLRDRLIRDPEQLRRQIMSNKLTKSAQILSNTRQAYNHADPRIPTPVDMEIKANGLSNSAVGESVKRGIQTIKQSGMSDESIKTIEDNYYIPMEQKTIGRVATIVEANARSAVDMEIEENVNEFKSAATRFSIATARSALPPPVNNMIDRYQQAAEMAEEEGGSGGYITMGLMIVGNMLGGYIEDNAKSRETAKLGAIIKDVSGIVTGVLIPEDLERIDKEYDAQEAAVKDANQRVADAYSSHATQQEENLNLFLSQQNGMNSNPYTFQTNYNRFY